MDHTYNSITAAAVGAIEAAANDLSATSLADAGSVRALAAGVYWSWGKLVGPAARAEDCDRMEAMISRMGGSPTAVSRPASVPNKGEQTSAAGG